MNKNQAAAVSIIREYKSDLKNCLDSLSDESILKVVEIIMNAYRKNKKVFILGNGGSAGNSSHMACDLSKGTLKKVYDEDEKRLRVISLTDNVSLMTAFANDLSYEDVFVQQLRSLIEKKDVVIALSASGNSKNVIKAVNYARKCGAVTVGFLGFKTGGKLAGLVDHAIITNSSNYGICEDMQLICDHIITSCIAKTKEHHDKKYVK